MSTDSYTRKDLILLQKYKDEAYKKALVDKVISTTRQAVLTAAMKGETICRVQTSWCSNKEEAEALQAQEQTIRETLKSIFPDSKVTVETSTVSFIVYEFWEIIITVAWGGLCSP